MSAACQPLTKREIARNILTDVFRHATRVPISEVVARARDADVSRRTLTRAAKDMGVVEIHNGPYGAFWQLP